MAHEPSLAPPGRTNIYGEQTFKTVVVFGAASVASYLNKDVTFARNSAGNFTLTLPRSYKRRTGSSFSCLDASGAVLFPVITSQTVSTDGKLVIELRTEAGVATDPPTGSELDISVSVSNDALNDTYDTAL